MASLVRWGILSTARIGLRRLVPAIATSQGGTVAAIASRNREQAAEVAARFDIPRAYGSYEALLDDPEVDAIYNPLPNSLHAEWTLRAARSGKHVLCEKPLALNAAEAEEMVSGARAAGVLLAEAFMYRFHPQIERLQALVAEGAIGTLWLVRAAFGFTVQRDDDIRLNAALGGGGLLDVGCYCVNITRLMLGEPQRFAATAVMERGVDVRLAAMLTFPTGTALIDCGLRLPFRQRVEVVGPDGTITVLRPFLPEEDPAVMLLRRGDEEERIEIPGTDQYRHMVEHFQACVRGEATLRFPPEDAIANMRALDRIREAAS